MKIPLGFQTTEFDCAPISLLNALNYLFERELIPAEILKFIYSYTLDLSDKEGNIGAGGTSKEAIFKIVNWLNNYQNNNFNLKCECLMNEKITLESMKKCLNNNGVCIVRCYQGVEHYVIITKIKTKFAYLFDPYYIKRKKYFDSEFKIILNKPFTYNRKVTLNRLFEESTKDFSLGKINGRQCILMNRLDVKNKFG